MLHPAGPGTSLDWDQEGSACPPTQMSVFSEVASPRPLQRCAAITCANAHPLHNAVQKLVMAELGLLPRCSLLQKCCSLIHCGAEELFLGSLLGAGHANSAENISPPPPHHTGAFTMIDVDTEVKASMWALLGASVAWPLPYLFSAG